MVSLPVKPCSSRRRSKIRFERADQLTVNQVRSAVQNTPRQLSTSRGPVSHRSTRWLASAEYPGAMRIPSSVVRILIASRQQRNRQDPLCRLSVARTINMAGLPKGQLSVHGCPSRPPALVHELMEGYRWQMKNACPRLGESRNFRALSCHRRSDHPTNVGLRAASSKLPAPTYVSSISMMPVSQVAMLRACVMALRICMVILQAVFLFTMKWTRDIAARTDA